MNEPAEKLKRFLFLAEQPAVRNSEGETAECELPVVPVRVKINEEPVNE